MPEFVSVGFTSTSFNLVEESVYRDNTVTNSKQIFLEISQRALRVTRVTSIHHNRVFCPYPE